MPISKLKGSNKRSGLCRLRINGEMTIYSVEEMAQYLSPIWEGYSKFELDLSKVNEIDTAGVQLLLMLSKKVEQSKTSITMLDCSPPVREVLDIYRLNDKVLNKSAVDQSSAME